MDRKSHQDHGDFSARRTSSADSTEPSFTSKPASTTRLLFINSPFDTTGQAHPQINQLSLTPLWRPLYVATLILVDIINMLFSLGVCSTIKPSSLISLENRIPIWQFTILQCVTWITCLLVCGTYHRHVMSEGYGLYSKIFNAGILTVIFTSCAVYMLNLQFPRILVIAVPMLACALDVVTRWLLRRVLHRCRLHGRCQYNAVIVGSPASIDEMLSTLDSSHANGYKPIAICPVALDPQSDDGDVIAVPYLSEERQDSETTGPKVIAFNSHFPRSVKLLGAQIVIVADVITRDNKIMHALPLAVESLGIEFALSISVADIGAQRIDLDYSGIQPILVASLPQYSNSTRFVKRAMDIVGSSLALIVSAPFIIFPAALAIKHEDHGPVFYKQKRIGLNGVPFDCYKLRSMCLNADQLDSQVAQAEGQSLDALFKVKEDPRVTKVGKFIRKYSIDEFPQFFNVLKGDMSLVGPRPQRDYEVATYGTLYSTRLLVKPGITGPWQISGRSDLSREEAEQLDISYIQHWSITGDLAILAKTFVAVLKHRGSY
ncbi:sugar transferase [Bifidobacterium sp. B4081]|uniref:sugar transferase n=1 Tax=unclassified Bifidobacterium TaxID=2608897 RepID=UPI002269AF23|nr:MULTISPECIES: sugar transferase [unclassified Bifidobacterium]MCX8644666.1 sugar transferase [Bifidobacterium sp. B4077]MCX8646480.1 sugar transferase [Bifidobacterium sp. B4081]MCX8668104.1 sugar transferase [Bifidobacterium sp. B3998]